MKKTILFLISLSLSAFSYAKAVTHDLADSGGNICDDSGAGQLDGTVYRCSTGSLTLRNGDSVIYSGNSGGKPITLEVMHGDITLEGNNSVGSQQQRINLKTSSASSSLQVMKPSENKKNKKKDSNGYRDIVIKNGSTVWGDIYAHNDVTIKNSVIRGNITSDGGGVITEASENKIFGNVTALHAVAIKQALVCGTLESKGLTVTVENSKTNGQGDGGGNHNGVFALHNAIKSHGQVTLKQADVCGSISSQASQYNYKQDRRYCGVNEPNCNYAPAGKCSISDVKAVCGWDVEPEPKQCKPLPPENFDNGSLANWSVMGFESSTQPQTNNGRFRLNESIRRQATASAYNYVFPSAQNYLQVEFDHYAFGGDGADGIALVLSDANVPPKTGAFGGPLGYGIKLKKNHSEEVTKDIEGFAGGWLGIGLDEYGNFYRTGGEVVNKHSPRKQNLIGIRGPGSTDSNGQWLKGYKYIKGYEHKQDGQPAEDIDNRSSTPHRYRVVLNSREAGKYYLSVERRIGAGEWNTLIEKFDVLQQGSFNAVPENFRLSVTASTGWSTNTHEIDNFQVCADEAIPLTEGIHHFEFDYSGSGSTCQASEVELRACMNQDCSKRYPRDAYNDGTLKPLNVTLTPSAGNSIANWVGSTQVTVENQKELALQASESGTVTMGVASSSVPQFGFEGARCRINNGPLSAENCDVTFVKNVLAVNVADVVANRQSQGEDHLSFCSAQADADGESRNVRMSMAYEVAPVDKTQPVSIWYKQKAGNKALEWSEEAVISPEGTVLNDVYFDSQGKAYFKIKYPEAGKVKLNASVDGVGDSAGFASFVSFPEYLKLTATKADKKGTCTKAVSGCSNSFVAAGELFDLTVTAYQAADGNTEKVAKNYQEPAITIANSVKYPAEGASATLLNTSLPEGSKWANGKVMLPQSVSEVGAFEFSVAAPVASDENGKPLATSSYLGSSAFKIQDAVATIGRFYPAYFNVTETNWDYPDNQGESAYMGQAFDSVSFAVTAYNASGGATQNYGLFASGLKADFYLSGEHSDRLNIANADLGDKNWSGAVWRKQWDNSVQWSKPISPDGPFNSKVVADKSTSTTIGLSLSNSGGKTSSYVDPTLFRFKSSVNGNERLTTSVAQVLLAQPDVRFGRIALDDVGGNQGSTLHIPLRIEYWNDSRFIVNQDDSQTKVMGVMEKDSLSHIWPTGASAAPKAVTLGGGGTVSSGSSRSITATQAEPYRQQTRVWLDLDDSKNGLPWLKYNWDNKKAGEENPSSVVTFGIHRGNDRVIYRGEPGLTGQ
ncbi:hypothetical protein V8073_003786 [Vibrio parahaemolyticus]|uniref:DUF6701 domain-containing protein n=1 Tax=Vibrio parahaemolyticus TaxID=670 RepID=UPI0004070C61|nr:DUF6701 domain-containing protein [Vibrio parahaemolyticus]EHR6441806.1 hypothetical protein [Vibrio parahaemolyticus]MBM4941049.1 hypothetical protein [Vibrio parahaemolyticus]MDF4596015.1 hypothetical protein [Vibrio parahaemolyticus]HCG5515578.1 hypothetical protein [Vibrio parahaemolyticus]HCG6606458.1 hypothetical protein [Vibrio parahaemolyticus]